MSGNIGTAREVLHEKCGKGIVRVVNGVPQVECTRKGCRVWVPLEEFVERESLRQAMDLLLRGHVSPADVIGLAKIDPLAAYRGIEGLICIGPAELDKACRSLDPNNPNPLGLADGWVPRIEVDARTDAWIRSCIWRDDPEWGTRMVLVPTPLEIGGIPTSLVGQNRIWGVEHDGVGAGLVRSDVFYTNFFVGPNYDWANVPAADSWTLQLVYEHPLWTTELVWRLQKREAAKRGMPIAPVAPDAFALNVILAVTGIRFRADTWSRTSTEFDGRPLVVRSGPYGVFARRYWLPGYAFESLAASVQGVPRYFDA